MQQPLKPREELRKREKAVLLKKVAACASCCHQSTKRGLALFSMPWPEGQWKTSISCLPVMVSPKSGHTGKSSLNFVGLSDAVRLN